jgi:hypothetical protein
MNIGKTEFYRNGPGVMTPGPFLSPRLIGLMQ